MNNEFYNTINDNKKVVYFIYSHKKLLLTYQFLHDKYPDKKII